MSADAHYDPSVPLAEGGEEPIAYAECIRIARRLRRPGMSPTGFLPAGEDIAVPPVGVALAAAMADVSSATIAYIDALARITRAEPKEEGSGGGRGAAFHWLRDRVAVVTPRFASQPTQKRHAAEEAIAEASRSCRHVLVDLSGFRRMGELPTMVSRMKGVALVAGRLATREATLVEIAGKIPASKRMGALLVG